MQIESRPMRSDPLAAAVAPGVGRRFRYLFYLDVVGNLADPAMQNALRHLQARPDCRHGPRWLQLFFLLFLSLLCFVGSCSLPGKQTPTQLSRCCPDTHLSIESIDAHATAQEVTTFLRVLGCYPREVSSLALQSVDLPDPIADAEAAGQHDTLYGSDELLFALASATGRLPHQVRQHDKSTCVGLGF